MITSSQRQTGKKQEYTEYICICIYGYTYRPYRHKYFILDSLYVFWFVYIDIKMYPYVHACLYIDIWKSLPLALFIYIYICPMYSYVYVSVNAYVSLYLHWYTHTFVKLYHILIHYLLSSIHYTIMWANSPPPNVPCACCFALMKFRRNTCKLYGIWTYFRWTPFESLSFGGCFTAGVPPTIWQGWQIGPFGTVATETYWFPLLFFSTWWVKCLLW